MNTSIYAITVTHNRKEMLRECLRAVCDQSMLPSKTLVVDNASTDGTAAMLQEEFPQAGVLSLPSNVGGAGGFNAGIKWAYDRGANWLWLMDDDCIPTPLALERLHDALCRFPQGDAPLLLASQVQWTDGSRHPMNYPNLSTSVDRALVAVNAATVALRSTSFVSLLLSRQAIEEYGLPLASYFIWNDDAEYTARILRHEFGAFVPDSIVIHKTKEKYTPASSGGDRYYYEVRNKLWMLFKSNAWERTEKVRILVALRHATIAYLKGNRFSRNSLMVVARGLVDGAARSPSEVRS